MKPAFARAEALARHPSRITTIHSLTLDSARPYTGL